MKWDFNKQITTIILVLIIMLSLIAITGLIVNANPEITYHLTMDNNSLEAFKTINYSVFS